MNLRFGFRSVSGELACRTSVRVAAVTGTALAGMLAFTPAFAQASNAGTLASKPPVAQADDMEEIVVTGTQIRGAAPVGSSIIAVDQKEITRSGLVTTNDVLRSIPQVSGIGPGETTTGPTVQNSNANNNKANSVNLRGLGPQATLSLLDGRRLPPGGTGAQLFDPSSFPTIALARIDVVADGASATYGSDAVAGVVNFILRRDVDGLEVSGRYGGAADYRNQQLSFIGGHRWGTGSVMLSGEYLHNSQLLQSDRSKYFNCDETSYGYANNCAGNAPTPGNLIFGTTVYGLPSGSGVGVTAAQLSTTRNTIPSNVYQVIAPEGSRYSGVGSVRQELGAVTLWAEGYFTRRDGFYASGTPTINTAVPSTNPNFIRVPGQSTTTETVQYSLLNDFGPVPVDVQEQGWQASGGIDVKLSPSWTLSAYYEHNNDAEHLTRLGSINANLLRTALACTTSICFNPYGSGGTANAAAVASFMGFVSQNSFYDSNLVNAKVDGTLFDLPGGAAKIAVGGEYHRDSLYNHSFTNSNGSATTLQTIVPTAETTSARKVYSFYGEVIVPIFGSENAISGFQKLTLNVAGRYDHYSDFGATTNPKVGFTWQPVSALSVRGSYGTSFRAPTVSDINPLSTATILLSSTVAGPGRNVATVVGGNANLNPETATTWSGGIDFHPEGIPGLTGSVNYYKIAYRNIIDTPGNNGAAVFANPALYAPFVTLNPNQAQIDAVKALPFYSPITTFGAAGFAPGNVYAIVDGRRNNVGSLHTNGIDVVMNYSLPSDIGSWNLGASGTYVFHYNYQLIPGAAVIDRINQATFPLRFRARAQIGWNNGPWDINLFGNYTNPYRAVALVSPTQNDRIKGYETFDGTIGYAFGTENGVLKGLRLTLSAINMFDRKPPIAVVSTAQEYDSGAASILGRQVSFNIRKAF